MQGTNERWSTLQLTQDSTGEFRKKNIKLDQLCSSYNTACDCDATAERLPCNFLETRGSRAPVASQSRRSFNHDIFYVYRIYAAEPV